MIEQTTRIDNPIEVMSLMHVAFRAASERTEELASKAQDGGDLAKFNESFNFWIKQLLYHATAEDKYMTGPLTDSQPARDNETEHAELVEHGGGIIEFLGKGDAAGLTENVQAAMLAMEGEEHKELLEKVAEVEEVLKKGIGETRVVARTRRHLYRRVTALRVLEFDHFENEEAFVVTIVAEKMSEQEQLGVAKHLLIDEEADDPRWIIDWVASELNDDERKLLSDLEGRFN
jgi:hypothetical protein